MHFAFLASGSSGNATLLCEGRVRLLVDCGMSLAELERRLAGLGLTAGQLTHVLITHEHSDHVAGLAALLGRHALPVYATAGTFQGLTRRGVSARIFAPLLPGKVLSLDGLQVLPFALSHDARQTAGLVCSSPTGVRFGFATDLGCVSAEVLEALHDCHYLAVEANHDEELLRRGPYPWFLKRRIRSSRGHLSNAEAGRLVESVATPHTRAVYGLHLSKTNNDAGLATACLARTARRLGLRVHVEAIVNGAPRPTAGGELPGTQLELL